MYEARCALCCSDKIYLFSIQRFEVPPQAERKYLNCAATHVLRAKVSVAQGQLLGTLSCASSQISALALQLGSSCGKFAGRSNTQHTMYAAALHCARCKLRVLIYRATCHG
jgi:hypothetical protein